MRMGLLEKPKKVLKGYTIGCLFILASWPQMLADVALIVWQHIFATYYQRAGAQAQRRPALAICGERPLLGSSRARVHALSVCLSAAALAPDLEEAGVMAERLISPEGSDK